ncbi:low molecular weight phosphatase family protein [Azotobacter armeniacus]
MKILFSGLAGTDAEIAAAFDATLERIKTRILTFLALPLDQLDGEALKAELARIGSL